MVAARQHLFILPALALALWLPSCAPTSDQFEDKKAPNVLLISIDTLRADHVGSYGYPRDTTPFLDQLAEQGTRFERAYVNTHGTPPSHATLLTGLYQESHRVSFKRPSGEPEHRLADELVTMAESFGTAGYRTVAYTGAGWVSSSYAFDQGFDIFVEKQRPVPAAVRAFTGELERLLEEGDEPIFAFFHTYEVHSPYGAPEPFKGRFGTVESSFRPNNKNLLKFANRAQELEKQDLDAFVTNYDEGIAFTDEAIKTMFGRLEALGFLDQTMVIITADHGEEFGEHGGLLHGRSLYEELVRVPLIALGPGLPVGEVSKELVSQIDIAPTLLGLAGVEHEIVLPGHSLFAREPGGRVFLQYLDDLAGVVSEHWKLIRRSTTAGAPQQELYDLDLDPHETTNLAHERPDVVAELELAIDEWKKGCVKIDLSSRAQTAPVEESKIEELRELGYIE